MGKASGARAVEARAAGGATSRERQSGCQSQAGISCKLPLCQSLLLLAEPAPANAPNGLRRLASHTTRPRPSAASREPQAKSPCCDLQGWRHR